MHALFSISVETVKILGLASIKNQSNIIVLDWCLININPRVFIIWDFGLYEDCSIVKTNPGAAFTNID